MPLSELTMARGGRSPRISSRRVRMVSRFSGSSGIERPVEVTESVVGVETGGTQGIAMLVEQIPKVRLHAVTEDNGVGYLHHGRLHVQGEEHALFAGVVELLGEKGAEGISAHHRGVDDFAFEKFKFLLEGLGVPG